MPRTCSRPCAFERKKTKKRHEIPPHTKKKRATKYIHSSSATTTTSRRRAVKHVPLGSPYSHSSSIDPGFVESASLVCTRMYILALLLLLRRLCTFWFSILFSGQRSFVFLCCDTRMYLRFRGCPVVLTGTVAAAPPVYQVCFSALHYFLASAASSFSAVILACISGFGVVRWCLTLSFPRAYGITRLDLYCCFLEQRAYSGGFRCAV